MKYLIALIILSTVILPSVFGDQTVQLDLRKGVFDNTCYYRGGITVCMDYLIDQLKDSGETMIEINATDIYNYSEEDEIMWKGKWYHIVKLEPKFIENQTIVFEPLLDVDLDYIEADKPQTKVILLIQINQSEYSKLQSDHVLLSYLDISVGKTNRSQRIKFDESIPGYKFEDYITLDGDYRLYPLDYYTNLIYVSNGRIKKEVQIIDNFQEQGFKFKVYSEEKLIKIIKQRSILGRYIIGVISLTIFLLVFIPHMKNVKKNRETNLERD